MIHVYSKYIWNFGMFIQFAISLSDLLHLQEIVWKEKNPPRHHIFPLCWSPRCDSFPLLSFFYFLFFHPFIFSPSTCQGSSQTTIPDRLRNVLCLIWKQETYRNVILKEYVWSKVFAESIDTLQQFDSYTEWFYRNLIKIYCQIYCHW